MSCTVHIHFHFPLVCPNLCEYVHVLYVIIHTTCAQAFQPCADIYTYVASCILTILVHSIASSPPSLLSLSFSLSLPLSNDLPTDQVYLYDGTQSCRAANFMPFLVLAMLIIFGFVLVAPFLLCLLTKKRWTVSLLHAHCHMFVVSLLLVLYD